MSYYDDKTVPFDTLVGKTIVRVENSSDRIKFHTSDGKAYDMYHEQDCCESVSIEDICGGTLQDLIGQTILIAYESCNADGPVPEDSYADESYTWTFYTIRTMFNTLTIRWFGTSNGYYSESVDFVLVDGNKED